MMKLTDLPPEVLEEIVTLLPATDICSVRETCSHLLSVCDQQETYPENNIYIFIFLCFFLNEIFFHKYHILRCLSPVSLDGESQERSQCGAPCWSVCQGIVPELAP